MDYLAGDQVSCKLLDGEIVGNKTKSHDREMDFLIVALDFDDNYVIYVPDNIYVKDTFQINAHNTRELNIPDRYIGSQGAVIGDRHVVRLHYRSEGITCARCNEHYQYAEHTEGAKFFCYACRKNPYR